MSELTAISPTQAIGRQWDAAASGWDAALPVLRNWLGASTSTMLAAAGIGEGQQVLDVAAGAGDQTMQLVDRVGPSGRILATDLSPLLVERLQSSATRAGHERVEARVADAQLSLPETNVFDAAICRLGLMLMPDPARCLSSVRSALKPEGRFCALVFAGPQDNPCLRIVMTAALRHAGLPSRDPYAPGGLMSLGRPGQLDAMFETAGFRDVATCRIEAPFRVPSVDDYIEFLRTSAAPVMAILATLEATAREAAWRDIGEQLAHYGDTNGWVGPNTLLLTTGRKP